MSFPTTLAACSLTPSSNGPAGTDLPSDLDDSIRQCFALIAQLRDGGGMPTGVALPWLTSAAAPTGWIKLNGALISRTTYANLFTFATAAGLISEATWTAGQFGSFSVGDGSTTFRLPDWRAMFIRGLDESRGIDISRVLGVWQDAAVTIHNHGYTDPNHVHAVADPGHQHTATTDTQGDHAHSYTAAVNNITVNAGAQAAAAQASGATTSVNGAHAHNLATDIRATGVALYAAAVGITISNAGVSDGHPRNLAYPHIIKF